MQNIKPITRKLVENSAREYHILNLLLGNADGFDKKLQNIKPITLNSQRNRQKKVCKISEFDKKESCAVAQSRVSMSSIFILHEGFSIFLCKIIQYIFYENYLCSSSVLFLGNSSKYVLEHILGLPTTCLRKWLKLRSCSFVQRGVFYMKSFYEHVQYACYMRDE